MEDGELISGTFKAFLYVMVVLVLVFVGSYTFWYLTIRADTSVQGVVRTNINYQAPQQIANNSYLHSLLGTIESDKQGIREFRQNLDIFCQVHQTTRTGDGCKDTSHIVDYNDQQELVRDEDNLTAAYTSLVTDINSYNQYFGNKDVIGVDSTLPKHVGPSGAYTDIDGTYKVGVK